MARTLAIAWGGSITFVESAQRSEIKGIQAHDGQVLHIEFKSGRTEVGEHGIRSGTENLGCGVWSNRSANRSRLKGRSVYFHLNPDGKRLATRLRTEWPDCGMLLPACL